MGRAVSPRPLMSAVIVHQPHDVGPARVCVADPHVAHRAAVCARVDEEAPAACAQELGPQTPAGIVVLVVVRPGVPQRLDRIGRLVCDPGQARAGSVGADRVAEAPVSPAPPPVHRVDRDLLEDRVLERLELSEARVGPTEHAPGGAGAVHVGGIRGGDHGLLHGGAERPGLFVANRLS